MYEGNKDIALWGILRRMYTAFMAMRTNFPAINAVYIHGQHNPVYTQNRVVVWVVIDTSSSYFYKNTLSLVSY